MAVRIKDIANAAGVSPATVSMVLNSRPGVGDSTRQAILNIARSMNYDSERSANLTSHRDETIRFLYISRHGHVVNNEHEIFIANYIDGLGREARKLHLNLEILTIQLGSIEEIVKAAQDQRSGGTIVLGTELSAQDVRCFQSVDTPIVFIDNYDEVAGFDFVDMNNKESVFMAIEHFVKNGHREIGIVASYVTTPNFAMRAAAFKEALAYHGLPYTKDFCFTVDSTFPGVYKDMIETLPSRNQLPTALFCSNDIMAFGCIKALKEKGIRVPEDVSIIGFDNLPTSAMLDPALTTIEVSKRQIGKLAVRILNERMKTTGSLPTVKVLVSGELVERYSVRDLTRN
jgi:LacI family transcriptional regulator